MNIWEARQRIEYELTSPFWKVNDEVDPPPRRRGEGRLTITFASRPTKRLVFWEKIVMEADDLVSEMVNQYGHLGSRAVIQWYNEIAITCDDCGMWGVVAHFHESVPDSVEERHGDVFEQKCDWQFIHRQYGVDLLSLAIPEPTIYGVPADEEDRVYRRMTTKPESSERLERKRIYSKQRRERMKNAAATTQPGS